MIPRKFKFFLSIIFFMVCFLSANLATAKHHMDVSDCAMQTSCSQCFISVSINGPDPGDFFFASREIFGAVIFFESFAIAPTLPPPKY